MIHCNSEHGQYRESNFKSNLKQSPKEARCVDGESISNTLPGHDTSSQSGCQPRNQVLSISSPTSPLELPKSDISASKKTDKNIELPPSSRNRKRDYVTKYLGFMRSASSPPRDSQFKDPMQMLYNDYRLCLEQLSTLRAAIEVTSQISFCSEGDRVYGCKDAALTFELIKKVKRHGKITLKCLQACLMDSVALRKI